MIKLSIIKTNKEWLEATWTKEVTTLNEVEKDGELVQEESVTTEQVHCESFSGHREHIAMLRAKATEFGTSLDEYEVVIAECESKFVYPSAEEIEAELLAQRKQEALNYLASTDWYVTRLLETGVEIPEEVSKLRAEARLVA